MNETTPPDLTGFTEFKTIGFSDASLLNSHLEGGWKLISVGISRGKVWPDGTFSDDFVALLGRKNPKS